jgi:hypothetical protein
MAQNKFTWSKKGDSDEPQKIELELSEAINDLFMNTLKQFYLMPILEGEKKELPNGMTYYCFYLPGEDAELLKEAFLQAYTKTSGHNTSN